MKEIFKDIAGYEGLYMISNMGNVKSCQKNIKTKNGFYHPYRERILVCGYNKKGYCLVGLSKNGIVKRVTVHRLVMQAFIDNSYNYPQINHIDSNKKNNNLINLEWTNNSKNQKHSYSLGIRKSSFTGKTYDKSLSSKSIDQYDLSGKYLKSFSSVRMASEKTNSPSQNISKVLHGKRKTAGGYFWKFKVA